MFSFSVTATGRHITRAVILFAAIAAAALLVSAPGLAKGPDHSGSPPSSGPQNQGPSDHSAEWHFHNLPNYCHNVCVKTKYVGPAAPPMCVQWQRVC